MCDRAQMDLALSRLIDGDLTDEERRQVEEHLTVCPDCRRALSQLQAMEAAFSPIDPPPALQDNVLAALPKKHNSRREILSLLSAAACLTLVVSVMAWRGVFPSRTDEKAADLAVSPDESVGIVGAAGTDEDIEDIFEAELTIEDEVALSDTPAEAALDESLRNTAETGKGSINDLDSRYEDARNSYSLASLLASYRLAVLLPVYEGTPFDYLPAETLNREALTALFDEVPEGETFLCITLESQELERFYDQRRSAGYDDALIYRQEAGDYSFLLMPLD